MRQANIGTSVCIYPDSNVFIGDNIFVSLSNAVYPVGMQISITNMSTMRTKTLTYTSQLKNLTIDIADAVRMLHQTGGCSMNMKISAYTDNFFEATMAVNFYSLDGRTLTSRSHGSERTIYVYRQEELQKISLFLAGSGALVVNGHNIPVISSGRNSFDLRSYITHSGEWQACYRYGVKGGDGKDYTTRVEFTDIQPSTTSAVAFLEYSDIDLQPVETEIKGGGAWNDSKFNLADYCLNVIYEEVCDDFDFLELMYLNTDGCYRYLGGRIDSDTTNAKTKNYVGTRQSVYRNISQKHIEEASETVKVVFSDLRRDSYYQDILLSEHVWFRNFAGDWLPCSITDSKITIKSEDYADLSLNIELWKQ